MWDSNTWATSSTKRPIQQLQQHTITLVSTYVHPSGCLDPEKGKTYPQKSGDCWVSLPLHQQSISSEAANKLDTGASFHDADTCLLRTGLRISANFLQVTEQQTDGNDFKQ